MATLSVQTIVRAGLLKATTSCAATGDKFLNDAKSFVLLENASSASRTVTFVTPKTVLGLAVSDLAVTVSGSSSKLVGPFPKDSFNTTSGYLGMTYSAVTNLKAGVYKLSTT